MAVPFRQKIRDLILRQMTAAGMEAHKDTLTRRGVTGIHGHGKYEDVLAIIRKMPFQELDEDDFRGYAHFAAKNPDSTAYDQYAVIELSGESGLFRDVYVGVQDAAEPRWTLRGASLRDRTIRLAFSSRDPALRRALCKILGD